jgi:pyruvate formate-lyase activating enzyme-like uncharacterized protein
LALALIIFANVTRLIFNAHLIFAAGKWNIRMTAYEHFRLKQIEKNKSEYGNDYASLQFLSKTQAQEWHDYRLSLLSALEQSALFDYKNTKVDTTRLSPGCRLCAEGKWSCLFINGCCNGACFYCPARQDDEGVPSTNTVEFPRVNDYIAYLEEFKFTGVSLSGGEPLLTFDKSLDYLTKIKKRFGDNIYFWMYTNGLLFDADKAAKLRDAGLDEIRFDIGATGYRLDYLKDAIGVIPTVTVEIPAVPEKKELMQDKLRELYDTGVDYVNLHQLRLTPHNIRHFVKHGYTFSHGAKVTVPASELTALELIHYSKEQKINLPINYCSFVYKNRFQGAGARRRAAAYMAKDFEDITENGYIRTLEIKADEKDQAEMRQRLTASHISSWHVDPATQKLYLSAAALLAIEPLRVMLSVSYAEVSMRQALSYRLPFRKVELSTGREINIERWNTAKELVISAADFQEFISQKLSVHRFAHDSTLLEMQRYEFIASGLGEYF